MKLKGNKTRGIPHNGVPLVTVLITFQIKQISLRKQNIKANARGRPAYCVVFSN